MTATQGLPPTLSVPEAAAWTGSCADAIYDVIREGTAPFPVLRVGRSIRIPTAALLRALGVSAAAVVTVSDSGCGLRVVPDTEATPDAA